MILWIILGIVIGLPLIVIVVLWLFGERWHLFRRSTCLGLREHGLRGVLSGRALHMYAYGRWTNQYLKWFFDWRIPRSNRTRRQQFIDHVHAKILTQEQAEAIVQLEHDINHPNAEQIIPYPVARDIVIQNPQAIAIYECGCRHRRKEPCQPTQVCMIIGQPFADFVLEHNPHTSRRLNKAEALDVLRAEHDRGHVHTAWFKDACLNRFYAICNCCKCCCGGIEAMIKYGTPIFTSSGYVAKVDEDTCTTCGVCVDTCPFGAISLNGIPMIDYDKCMGCGACQSQCTSDSLSLIRAPDKGVPLDVRAL